jgi:hypothetical protein
MSAQDGERIAGIEQPLPPGEHVLWQGQPDTWSLARHAFHVRVLWLYFAVLVAWRAYLDLAVAGNPAAFAAASVLILLLGGTLTLAITALAYISSRTSIYALTDRRLVLRIGVLAPTIINVPFRQIQSVAVRAYRDGTGDFSLGLATGDRIAFLHLWPHARAWRLSRPEPTLRSVPNASAVGVLIRGTIDTWGGGVSSGPSAGVAASKLELRARSHAPVPGRATAVARA